MPLKRPRCVKRGQKFFCPVTGCGWSCTNSHSYSRHYDGKHTPSFKFICKWGCGAGQDRSDLAQEHAGSCQKDREANQLRRGTKPRYATPRQAREAQPAAPEEAVQEMEESLEVVERENQKLMAEKEQMKEKFEAEKEQLKEKFEMEKEQLKKKFEAEKRGLWMEKEELKVYVGKLEAKLKEMGEQEHAMDVDTDPEVAEPLEEDGKQLEEEGQQLREEDNGWQLVLSDDEEVLMEEVGQILEKVVEEEDNEYEGGDQLPVPPSLERQEPGIVEHQLVDEVLETGGKVLDVGRRKSTRRTGAILQMEKDADIEARLRSNVDSDLLQVVEIEGKGRAVKTLQPISKADYVVEYAGDLIDAGVAKDKEDEYAMDLSKGCYLFYFLVGGKKYCVDATAESGRLGRLLNHSMLHPNCGTKVAMVDGRPRLYFVAKQEIPVGTELVFDYGDRSKASLLANPWLAL
jgi:histone-lysine N-methyltransferase SETD8